MRPVLDAMPKNIDRAALADLPLQAGQELSSCWAVGIQAQRFGDPRLGLDQEGVELSQVHAVLALIVIWVAADPAGTVSGRPFGNGAGVAAIARCARHGGADQPLESAFAGVAGHTPTSSVSAARSVSVSASASAKASKSSTLSA